MLMCADGLHVRRFNLGHGRTAPTNTTTSTNAAPPTGTIKVYRTVKRRMDELRYTSRLANWKDLVKEYVDY